MNVVQVFIEGVIEQAPALQKAARLALLLIGHQAIADAPDGAGGNVAEHHIRTPCGQAHGDRALLLFHQAGLQEVSEIAGRARVGQGQLLNIAHLDGAHRSLGRYKNREQRSRQRFAFTGQIHAHGDAGQGLCGGGHHHAAPTDVAQKVAQAGCIGKVDR